MGHEKLHKRETVNQQWRRSKDRPAVDALSPDPRIGRSRPMRLENPWERLAEVA